MHTPLAPLHRRTFIRGLGTMKRVHFHYAEIRPLADLWLTLARQCGVKRDRFADSTGAMNELF
jgi:hypothetical protein